MSKYGHREGERMMMIFNVRQENMVSANILKQRYASRYVYVKSTGIEAIEDKLC